jgi:predicted PurR-regulated permease PerM
VDDSRVDPGEPVDQPDTPRRRGARNSATWQRRLPAMMTMAIVVLGIACLHFGKPVLIPTAMAVLLTFLLAPPVTWLQRRRLPRALAVGIVVSVAGLVVAGVGWLFTSQVLNLASELPV